MVGKYPRPSDGQSSLPTSNFSQRPRIIEKKCYFTSNSSTSKIKVALGGMTPPAP
jgi:hypothetical protein